MKRFRFFILHTGRPGTAVMSLAALMAFSTAARADTITYQIFNHPDGSAIGVGVDEDGYVVRLDIDVDNSGKINKDPAAGEVHTFNANAPGTGVTFSFDLDTGLVTLTGIVSHNESGSDPTQFDADDDFYLIDATFQMVLFVDDVMIDPWYDGFTDIFNDMLAALLNDANPPDTGAEMSEDFDDEDVARIYFETVDLTLTPLIDGNGDGFYFVDQGGALVWDEFPNDGSKPFFIQYRWRLWDSEFSGDEFNVLAAAGWLEAPPGSGSPNGCCQDFLFIFGHQVVPEPSTVLFLGLGLAGLGIASRRRRRLE